MESYSSLVDVTKVQVADEATLQSSFDATVWEDVTPILHEATQAIGVGEIIQAPVFSLHEAMSCIELMCEKMDVGMGPRQPTVHELFDAAKVPLELTRPQIVAVFDTLLQCEMTWQQGYSLAQTLFICAYMHKPNALADPLLRSLVLSYLKTTEVIKTIVVQADVYEEEDFLNCQYGFDFASGESTASVQALLKDQDEALSAEAAALRKDVKAAETGGAGCGTSDEAVASLRWLDALLARVRFRRAYHAAHVHLHKAGCSGIEQGVKSLQYAQKQLDLIAAEPAMPPLDGVFIETLNRNLLGAAPPKPVTLLPREASIGDLRRLLDELIHLCDIVRVTSLDELTSFLEEVALSEPQPNIVLRSHARVLTYSDKRVLGRASMQDMIRASMLAHHIPSDAIATSRGTKLLTTLASPVFRMLELLTLNRGRQRRRTMRSLVDWANLQLETDETDGVVFNTITRPDGKQALQSSTGVFLSSWLLDRVVRAIIHHTNLGFQCNLYGHTEYCMVYWYLDYLYGVRLTVANQCNNAPDDSKGKGKGKNKKKDKGHNNKAAAMVNTVATLTLELHQALCRGYFRLIAALSKHGVLRPQQGKHGEFSSQAVRFQRRFGPLVHLQQPQALSYDHFVQSTDVTPFGAADLYGAATESFKAAKAKADEIIRYDAVLGGGGEDGAGAGAGAGGSGGAVARDVSMRIAIATARVLLKVSVTNAVLIARMQRTAPTLADAPPMEGVRPANDDGVLWDFAMHQWYPVCKMRT